MGSRILLFLISATLSFPCFADPDFVRIYFRHTVDLADVVRKLAANDPTYLKLWPEVDTYLNMIGKRDLRTLSKPERGEITKILAIDPRYPGHLALGIPNLEGRMTSWGFRPYLPEDLPEGHELKNAGSYLDYAKWLFEEKPIPAGFQDENEWLKDPTHTSPLFKIDIPVSSLEKFSVENSIADFNRDPTVQYQLPLDGKELDPNCYNCINSVRKVFEWAELPVRLLAKSGATGYTHARIQIAIQDTSPTCHYQLDRVSGKLHPK